LRRGEVWTAAGGPDYAGKPRPVVIVQDNRFDATESITVCGLTSQEADAPDVRILIAPSAGNGLRTPSKLMVDKIATMSRLKLRQRLGQLDNNDLHRLNRAMVVFLGLTNA
jgi:mRNA interferase MazF